MDYLTQFNQNLYGTSNNNTIMSTSSSSSLSKLNLMDTSITKVSDGITQSIIAINCDLLSTSSSYSNSTTPSPNSSSSSSSSNDYFNNYLSSDEGYVGSFNDSHTSSLENINNCFNIDLHKMITIQEFNKKQNQIDELSSFNNLYDEKNYRQQLEIDYQIEIILSQLFNGNKLLNNDLDLVSSSSFNNNNNNIKEKLNMIDEYLLLPYYYYYLNDAKSNIDDNRNDDWKLTINKNELNTSSTLTATNLIRFIKRIKREQKEEDLIDLNAYLNEIELNLEIYKNDHLYDSNLSFIDNKQACNLIKYEKEITKWFNLIKEKQEQYEKQLQANKRLSQLFAHIDYIPEFVPNTNALLDDIINENELYYQSSNSEVNIDLDETLLHQEVQMNLQEDQVEVVDEINDGEEFYMEDIYENNTNNGDFINENGSYETTTTTTQYLNENGCYSLSKKLAIDIQQGGLNLSETSSQSSSLGSSLTTSQRLLLPRLLSKYGKCDAFRKPCVYMLNEGRCMRADCRFAHDLHNITCKYWLEGECLKGESCEFMHDFPSDINIDELFSEENLASSSLISTTTTTSLKSKNSSNRKDIKNQVFNLNTNDFPELGQIKPNKINNNNYDDNLSSSPLSTVLHSNDTLLASSVSSNTSTRTNTSTATTTTTTTSKKNKKFNILYSLSLPAMANSSRKKNIN